MKRFALIVLFLPLFACAQPPKPAAKDPAVTKLGTATVVADVATSGDFAKAEATSRLDVFVVGDSISAGEMAYNTTWVILNRTRNRVFKGWVLNAHPEAEKDLKGLFERLDARFPTRLTNASWSGAYVDKATRLDRSTANRLGNIQNFSAQFTRLLALKERPNLVLVAPFHNNLDFQFDLDNVRELKGKKKEDYLAEIPGKIKKEYIAEVEKVIAASPKGTKLSVVILGTLNLEAMFAARDEAAAIRKVDETKYPHFDVAHERFPSILQRPAIVALGKKVNEALGEAATELAALVKKQGLSDAIEVVYSDALNGVRLEKAKLLHAEDAFHPSAEGHQLLAEALEKVLADRLQFLGVKPR